MEKNQPIAVKIERYSSRDHFREADIIDRLKSSDDYPDSLIKFFGVSTGRFDGRRSTVIEMEYFPGQSFEDIYQMIEDGKVSRIDPDSAHKYLLVLSSGVNYMHRQLIAHRDIKPSNIMYAEGQVKLVDMNLSCLMESGFPSSCENKPVGAIGYADPTLFTPGRINWFLADTFSLAMTFAVLLTGYIFRYTSREDPQGERTKQEVIQALKDMTEIPPLFRQLLTRCMNPNPKLRLSLAQLSLALVHIY